MIRALPIALFAAALAACGSGKTIRPEGAEKSVVDVVSQQTGFRPNDVDCPSGVDAEVGEKFECSFTGPEGPYTAFMEVRKVDGEKVLFTIVTRRTAAN
ncbi:MAG TPA: DUF4333 domain-containing protein [Thermoleophilaceae bacterium]